MMLLGIIQGLYPDPFMEVSSMFDSLDEQMKHDEELETTPRERWLQRAVVVVVSLILFAGLYMGVRMLE